MADKTGLTIANCLAASAAAASRRLVTSRRDGKAVIYRLTDAKTLALMDLLRVVAERNLAQVGKSCEASMTARMPEPSAATTSRHASKRGPSHFSMSGPPMNLRSVTYPVR